MNHLEGMMTVRSATRRPGLGCVCALSALVSWAGPGVQMVPEAHGAKTNTPKASRPAPDKAALPRWHWRHRFLGNPDFAAKPVLGRKEIQQAGTVVALQELYARKGHHLATPALVKQVANDWALALTTAYQAAVAATQRGDPLPDTLAGLHPRIAGKQYHLYALPHPDAPLLSLGQRYFEIIAHTVQAHPDRLFLGEQGFVSQVRLPPQRSIELPDHSARHLWQRIYSAGPADVVELVELLWRRAPRLKRTSSSPEQSATLAPDQQPGAGLPNPNTPAWWQSKLRLPPGLLNRLPSFVELELRGRTGRYTGLQLRSGYMAALLSALPAEFALAAGGTHIPEVAYFLKHPIQARRPTQLAEQHAAHYLEGDLTRLVEELLEAQSHETKYVTVPAKVGTVAATALTAWGAMLSLY